MAERFGDDFGGGYGPPPVRSGGSGCFRGCIIATIVVAVIAVIAVGVLGFLAYRFFGKAISTDPIEIQKRIEEVVPGAKVPDGYDPKFNMKFDMGFMKMNMSVIADKEVALKDQGDIESQEKGTVFMLMSLTVPEDKNGGNVEMNNRQDLKIMERKKIEYQAGPFVYEGFRFKALNQKKKEIEGLEFTIRKNTQLIVHSTGDEALDEEAVRKFLESCGPGIEQKKGTADGSDKPFGIGKPREPRGAEKDKPAAEDMDEDEEPAKPAKGDAAAKDAGKPAEKADGATRKEATKKD